MPLFSQIKVAELLGKCGSTTSRVIREMKMEPVELFTHKSGLVERRFSHEQVMLIARYMEERESAKQERVAANRAKRAAGKAGPAVVETMQVAADTILHLTGLVNVLVNEMKLAQGRLDALEDRVRAIDYALGGKPVPA